MKYALIGIQQEIVTLETRLKDLREQQSQMLKGVGVRKSPKELADATAASYGTTKGTKRVRKPMSQEARDKMKAAASARWARVRAAQSVTAPIPEALPDEEPTGAPVKRGRKKTGANKK